MSAVEPPDEFSEFSALLTRARKDADGRRSAAPDLAAVAATRRRRRRGRIAAATVVLVIAAAIGTYLSLTLLAPTDAATITVTDATVAQPAAVALELPDIGASAVSVTGAEDYLGPDGILASSGTAGPLPIASITKLITALVILDAKPLGPLDSGPTLTFSRADSKLYDKYYLLQATVQSMKSGSTMSQRDALELMLVVSACNYAEAVSTWAFGSQANFLAATRAWLSANGLTGTTIVEPTGIDPRNVSTPAELIALGKLALANPVVADIVRSPTLQVPTLDGVANNNLLLGTEGITGIKTGTLEQSGSNLLFSSVLDVGTASPITVVGVVLGGASHESVDAAVRALLASIRSGFHEVPLVAEGDVFGSYSTPWNDRASIVAGTGASVLTWSDTPITSSVETTPLETGTSGSTVGSVTFVAGNETITVPLELKGSLGGPDEWWRLTHPHELLG